MASKGRGKAVQEAAGPIPKEVVFIGGLILGLMFVVAGGSKAYDPWSFLSALASYGVPGALRVPVALALPAVEVVVGVLLLAGWATRIAGAVSTGLMVMFLGAIGYGSWLGTLEECGCFGPFIQRSPRDAALIDVGMLVLAVLVWRGASRRAPTLENWRGVVSAGIAAAAIAMVAVQLASGPTGIAAVSGGALDMRSVDLSRGEHLLYLFHYECPHCAEMSPRVARYTQDPSLPPVVAFTFRTPDDEVDKYLAKYGMQIPAQVLPPQQFLAITGEGAVPQLVYVRDGEIRKTWLGLLPEAEELRTILGGL